MLHRCKVREWENSFRSQSIWVQGDVDRCLHPTMPSQCSFYAPQQQPEAIALSPGHWPKSRTLPRQRPLIEWSTILLFQCGHGWTYVLGLSHNGHLAHCVIYLGDKIRTLEMESIEMFASIFLTLEYYGRNDIATWMNDALCFYKKQSRQILTYKRHIASPFEWNYRDSCAVIWWNFYRKFWNGRHLIRGWLKLCKKRKQIMSHQVKSFIIWFWNVK